MTPEYLLDGMNELPEHLLRQTDALRSRKQTPWRPLITAACTVLAIGIVWGILLGPGKDKIGFAEDSVNDAGASMDKVESESQSGYWWRARVIAVGQEQITVYLEPGGEMEVTLTQLEEVPEFTAGQQIRIYFAEAELPEDRPLKPYKIEIEEE